jgi:hypothetical protein
VVITILIVTIFGLLWSPIDPRVFDLEEVIE